MDLLYHQWFAQFQYHLSLSNIWYFTYSKIEKIFLFLVMTLLVNISAID